MNPRFSEQRMRSVFVYIHNHELNYYTYLTTNVLSLNIYEDHKFQYTFFIYYDMGRNRNMITPKKAMKFFRFFEDIKGEIAKNKNETCFSTILRELISYLDIPSDSDTLVFLCSALIHTIDQKFPIWDTNILDHFGIPERHPEIDAYIKAYSTLQTKCDNEISGDGKDGGWFQDWDNILKERKYEYPQFENFTDIKKLDLFFWKEVHVKERNNKINNLQKYRYVKYINCLFSESEDDRYIKYVMLRALIDKSLTLLRDGLVSYVKSEINDTDFTGMSDQSINALDEYKILGIMEDKWDEFFVGILENDMKTTIENLKAYRNYWAHRNPDLFNKIDNVLCEACKLLHAMNATEQAEEIGRMMNMIKKHEILMSR